MQILTEVPLGISKFGCSYRLSYVFNSLYLIPPFKRGRNVNHIHALQLMDREIDKRMSVDINLLRGLDNQSLYNEFD